MPEQGARASGGTFSAERAALRRAPGRVPYALIGLFVFIMAGLLALMMNGDEQRVYRELGRRINRAKLQGFDPFLACALRDDPQVFHNNADFSERVIQRARTGGPAFGRELREECLPLLSGLDDRLSVLIAPDAIKADLQIMVRSVAGLRDGFDALADDVKDGHADEADLHSEAVRVARPWYEFRRAHSAINHTLRKKLGAN